MVFSTLACTASDELVPLHVVAHGPPVGVQLLELRLQLARILAVEELDDLVQLSVEALPVALGLLLRNLTRQLAQNPVEAAAVARAREPRYSNYRDVFFLIT